MPFWRKTKFSGFLGLVSRRYVYVWRRRDQTIDRSTGDVLDRRRGPETEQLRPSESTPITLSVVEINNYCDGVVEMLQGTSQ